MKSWLKIILFLVIPVTAFLLILSGVFNHKIEPGTTEVNSEVIENIEVGEVTAKNYVSGSKVYGTIVSKEEAKLSAKMMAEVERIEVESGDKVTAGEAMIYLDKEQVQATLAQTSASIQSAKAKMQSIEETIKRLEATVEKAEANYNLQEKTYNRKKELYENGVISLQEYDMAETQYLAAKAQLAEAKASLETTKANRAEVQAALEQARAKYNEVNVTLKDATIRAPFDGIVIDTLVDTGDMANPGMPLIIVERAPYFLEVFVDERKKNQIKLGTKIPVTIDSLNKTVQGTVTEITPRIDPASRTFRVKIQLPNTVEVTSGMFGYAEFPESKTKNIFIPKSAVYYWSQLTAVYVVDEENIAHLRYVQLGEEKGDEVEVLSGLNEGEHIVLNNVDKVKDLAKVVTSE